MVVDMLRYKQLLLRTIDPSAPRPVRMRELGRRIGLPATTIHNYTRDDAIPKLENLQKIGDYFNEPLSTLLSDDDDLTARLVAKVRQLDPERKAQLLHEL